MIRDATPDDVPRLVEMGERFLAETVYRERRVVANPAVMARTVRFLLASDLGAVFVSEEAGAVVGMIGLLLFEHPITGDVTATELFWWVEPEHRGHGVRLLRHGERWARDAGAEQLQMVAPTAEIGRLYERLGFHFVESGYQKAIA